MISTDLDVSTLKNWESALTYFNFKSIVVVYRDKLMNIASMSQYIWTQL